MRDSGILQILAHACLTEMTNNSKEEKSMKNPLDSLWGTVIAGFVLTTVLYLFVRNFLG
ncbi:MAG: hypothetical protein ACYCZE_00170 [Thiobacillus sp.]